MANTMGHTAPSILPTPPAPQLPEFETLLIQGDYPPSSPLHLCLSHMSSASDSQQPRPKALLVTAKSRLEIMEALVGLNDEWLITNAGLGTTGAPMSELHIHYPGTQDHWMFLFALFQNGVPNNLDALGPNLNIHLDPPVSLVVLHEPSAYFMDYGPSGAFTLSSYLQLITSALASLPSFDTGSGPARLVVFDSRLHDLSLPILPGTNDEEDEGEHEPVRKHVKVGPAVEKYFEWVGTVETGKSTSRARAFITSHHQ